MYIAFHQAKLAQLLPRRRNSTAPVLSLVLTIVLLIVVMFDSTSLLVAALAGQALAAPRTLNWKRQSTQQPLLTDINVISQYWGE